MTDRQIRVVGREDRGVDRIRAALQLLIRGQVAMRNPRHACPAVLLPVCLYFQFLVQIHFRFLVLIGCAQVTDDAMEANFLKKPML